MLTKQVSSSYQRVEVTTVVAPDARILLVELFVRYKLAKQLVRACVARRSDEPDGVVRDDVQLGGGAIVLASQHLSRTRRA